MLSLLKNPAHFGSLKNLARFASPCFLYPAYFECSRFQNSAHFACPHFLVLVYGVPGISDTQNRLDLGSGDTQKEQVFKRQYDLILFYCKFEIHLNDHGNMCLIPDLNATSPR